MKGREGIVDLRWDGADGTGNDHDGRDVRDVNIVPRRVRRGRPIVPGTRQPSVVVQTKQAAQVSIFEQEGRNPSRVDVAVARYQGYHGNLRVRG
jgi:hypothetical protein